MSSTEKRIDVIADTLTIREMAAIIDGLTLLSNSPLQLGNRTMIWDTREMINAAYSTAVRNEHAGDYDYPEDAS